MNKPLINVLYLISLLSTGLTIHQAFAERGPAVEPYVEISMENDIPKNTDKGFDFSNNNIAEFKRAPANIRTKTASSTTPYSLLGPMIFILALPIGLWIIVSKKINSKKSSDREAFYPKTFQFKPYKTDYQVSAETDEYNDHDQDLPKAS